MNNAIMSENMVSVSYINKKAKLFRSKGNNFDSLNFYPANGERIEDYCKIGLYSILYELAKNVYLDEFKNLERSKRFDRLVEEFNNRFDSCAEQYIFKTSKNIWKIEPDLFEGLFLNDDEKANSKKIVKEFIESYDKLKKDGEELKLYFAYNEVDAYLNAYIKLCRFVFNDKCLNQEALRSSQIIEKILNIDFNESNNCFGLYSPYVIFSILRTLKYISILPDDIDHTCLSSDCAEYLNTRRHIVSTNAIRAFSRFTIINGKSYVVDYSRRNDSIICKNVENVSSVDNIKPIRLLEKITSYIYNFFEDNILLASASFTISIYGFCAYNNMEPTEVDDLIYEIFSWFEDKRKDEIDGNALLNKKINELKINFFLTQDTDKDDEEINYSYRYYDDNQNEPYNCSLKISKFSLKRYDNEQISKCIENSNTIFFLDCPWLAKEDYNIVNEGNLDLYAKWVQQVNYKNDIDDSLQEQVFFNRTYLLASINDQFNRLAIDNSEKYGKVVRVIKDYLLKWFQQQIEFYKNKKIYKTIYVYNSSMRGMALSDYADYPIIREESYSNKRFSIMRFSTRDNKCISVMDNQKVYVSLWNLIKYVDISFAYIGIKEYFALKLHGLIDESVSSDNKKIQIKRDIISIMRNIIFVIKYFENEKDKFTSINVQIAFCKPIRNFFKEESLQQMYDIIIFFKKIITETIFKNSNGLGDDSIRDAFERCLYNQSKTVEDLFFLHLYSDLRKKGDLSKFDVAFNWENTDIKDGEIDSLVPNFDSFGDKRAYNKLFHYLDMPRCPEYAVNSVINQTNTVFNKENSTPYSIQILRNMLKVCEISNYTESFLYHNLKNLLDN